MLQIGYFFVHEVFSKGATAMSRSTTTYYVIMNKMVIPLCGWIFYFILKNHISRNNSSCVHFLEPLNAACSGRHSKKSPVNLDKDISMTISARRKKKVFEKGRKLCIFSPRFFFRQSAVCPSIFLTYIYLHYYHYFYYYYYVEAALRLEKCSPSFFLIYFFSSGNGSSHKFSSLFKSRANCYGRFFADFRVHGIMHGSPIHT